MSVFALLRNSYLHQPVEVSFETLALCNARCVFCPYPTLDRKGVEMPSDMISGMIKQMAEFQMPFSISPFKVNEPFLDKRLIPICQEINASIPHASIRLFSNGQPLTTEKLTQVNQLHSIEHLWISLNSIDPVEYHELMGIHLRLTLQRLDQLHRMVQDGNFCHPVVLSKVSRNPLHEHHFKSYCADRWPNFRVYIIKQDGWLGFVPPAHPSIPDTPCVRWFELSILATGIASLCCMDGKGEFPIGDFNKQSLLEIYNTPAWKERREKLLSRHTVHPCSTCTY